MTHLTARPAGPLARAAGWIAALGFAFGGLWGGVCPQAAAGVDKSGVGPNVITLPDGPGSVQGMGEDFEAALSSGAAEYSFGIVAPPGLANYEAGLTFSYDSGGGNGPLGFGWGLDVPFLQRKTARGVPRYVDGPNGLDDDLDGETDEADEVDRLINDGEARLIPRGDGYYLVSEEEAFIRYEKAGDGWVGTEPTGTKRYFGETEQARIQDANGRIFAWFLERVEDPIAARTVTYHYARFDTPENQNQIYLAEIRYGAGPPPWENLHFVKFTYEARFDWFEDCLAGFPIRTGMRLKEVVTGTQGPELANHLAGDFNGDGTPDYLNRRYVLAYEKDPHWSLLTSIQLYGSDGVTTQPPMTMDYTQPVLEETLSTHASRIGSDNTPLQLVNNDAVDFVDLNGDALPDLLQTDPFIGPHKAYLNLGEWEVNGARAVKWADPVNMAGDQRAWGVNLASISGEVAFFDDMDGEGNADFVYKSGPNVYYFPSEIGNGNLAWGERIQMAHNRDFADPATPYGDDNTDRADIDGNQRGDIIQSVTVGNQAAYRVWFNYGGGQYSRPITKTHDQGIMLADSGAAVEDFNGDGLPDITRVRATEIWVLPGLGYGDFGPRIRVPIVDCTFSELDLTKVELEDINSDGLVDLLLVGGAPGEVCYWLNLGNYTLDQRRGFANFPVPVGAAAESRFADMNGNGTIDYVLMDPYTIPRMQIVDMGEVMGCVPNPNLLIRIDNGTGRSIRIDYESSAIMAVEDAAAGEPWVDPMPFPMAVVSGFHVHDGLGNVYDTEYRYRDGFYSPDYFFFTSFGEVTVTAPGEEMAPTQIMQYAFDVGKTSRAMIGNELRQTLLDEHGAAFWDKRTDWETRILYTGTDGHQATFAHPVLETLDIFEQGRGTPRRTETAFTYDDYGNETEVARYGIVEDGDRAAFNDEHIEVTNFAHNVDAWLLRFPSQVMEYDYEGELTKLLDIYYDDETFSGDNLGEVTLGRQTLSHEWFDVTDEGPSPLTGHGYIFLERIKYDPWGNPIFMMDPMGISPGGEPDDDTGHYITVEYDPYFHDFPIVETQHVGGGKDDLVSRADYDWGLGSATDYTDFNGLVTTHTYDARGLLASIVRPGHTAEFPTKEYEYVLNMPVDGGTVNYAETRLLDREPGTAGANKLDHYAVSRAYTDGMGRALMVKQEAEPAAGSHLPRVAVTEATLFNGQGLASFAFAPFFSALPGDTLEEQLAFEDLRAPAWQGQFEVDGETILLGRDDAPQTVTYYDAAFREARLVNADGTESRSVFEPLVERIYDGADNDAESPHFDTPSVHYMDGLERLIQVDEIIKSNDDGTPSEEPAVWSTYYEYRCDGVLEQLTDSQGNARIMIWDNSGAILEVIDPDGGWLEIVLDDGGNTLELNDWRSPWLSMTYDGINRLTSQEFHDEGYPGSAGRVYDAELPLSDTNFPDILYVYDDPAGEVDFGNGESGTARYTKGFLSYVIDLSGEEHNSYTPRGGVEWVVKKLPDPVTGELVHYRTGMTYGPQGNPTSLTYPDGDEVAYSYNERQLLKAITGGGAINQGATPYIIQDIEYTPSGQRARVTYGNGLVSALGYDRLGRMSRLRTAPQDAPANPVLAYQYTFDAASNITRIDDLRPGTVRGAGDPRRNTQLYAYDDLYRLLSAQYSFNLPGTGERDDGRMAYRYDRIGNMLAKTSTMDKEARGLPVADVGDMYYGGVAGAWDRSDEDDFPGPHALTRIDKDGESRHFRYDPGGSLIEADGFTFSWNFLEQLTGAENENMRAEYTYDYTGRRVLKRVWERGEDGVYPDAPTTSTVYVDRFFEIRDFEQPTKYVYDGGTRVAKVTGTLAADTKRVQRFRLLAGFNLVSLAVEAPDAVHQLGVGRDPNLKSVSRWNSASGSYVAVDAQTVLPRGSILWIEAEDGATLRVVGEYSGPPNTALPAAPGLYSFASLDAINLAMALQPGARRLATFDAETQSWRVWFGGQQAFLSDTPDFLASGQPVFVDLAAPMKADLPEAAQQIQYYLQDHLGSTSIVADAAGNVVRETAYYPFGEIRHLADHGAEQGLLPTPYGFTQKEQDDETGLHYFEVRYLASALGRFTSVDPLSDDPEAFIGAPQAINPYAYSENNPVVYNDPTGMKKKESLYGPSFRLWAKRKYLFRDQESYTPNSKSFGGAIKQLDKKTRDKATDLSQSDMINTFFNLSKDEKAEWVDKLFAKKMTEALKASVDKKGKLTETGKALQLLGDLTNFVAGAAEDIGDQTIDGKDYTAKEIAEKIRAGDKVGGGVVTTTKAGFDRLNKNAADFRTKLRKRIEELKEMKDKSQDVYDAIEAFEDFANSKMFTAIAGDASEVEAITDGNKDNDEE